MGSRIPPMEEQDRQYSEWLRSQTFSNVDEEKLKYVLFEEMKFLSSMSVEEYTLHLKWREIQEKYPVDSNPFITNDTNYYPYLNKLKNNIWSPKDPEDYKNIEPELLITYDNSKLTHIWNELRVFIHTQHNNSNIGRGRYLLVLDKPTGKYLGLICISSDFLDLTARDDYIGWTREQKTVEGRIRHTAIGSTIAPTQPLGYNYVGGKLMALLTVSDVVQREWENAYGDVLVGVTTTSLYGSFSQYQRLKYWRKCGGSKGSIKYEPSKNTIRMMKEWLRFKEPRKYWEWYVGTRTDETHLKRNHRQRSFSYIYRQLDIPKELVESNHQRGIYFCSLYNNTNEFLRDEIGKDKLDKKFDNSVKALTELWKERYAKKRSIGLLNDGRYNTDTLFYKDMIGMTWEECKENYLKGVGR